MGREMNHFVPHNNKQGTVGGISGPSISVACPRPRRIGALNPFPLVSQQIVSTIRSVNDRSLTEIADSVAGEVLDVILTEDSCSAGKSNALVASSPPFFFGTPPSRASNPLIRDLQFCSHDYAPSPQASFLAMPSPSTSRKSGSCTPITFGQKPAAVRIEGFNCFSAVA
ncbi:hypothetical protein NMG60_11005879 [Bertholletia excelsa]